MLENNYHTSESVNYLCFASPFLEGPTYFTRSPANNVNTNRNEEKGQYKENLGV